MTPSDALKGKTIGWIGIGRMGYAMALRLLNAGADPTIYYRTRSKAEPLGKIGAKIVDNLFHRKTLPGHLLSPSPVTPDARFLQPSMWIRLRGAGHVNNAAARQP
jgi:ketopantoate reductase|tara:strand:+ start:565 stop:879 length:315 start_codon:yes stop_codon:yes gene_type:complete